LSPNIFRESSNGFPIGNETVHIGKKETQMENSRKVIRRKIQNTKIDVGRQRIFTGKFLAEAKKLFLK
jgi:hypothetical protein